MEYDTEQRILADLELSRDIMTRTLEDRPLRAALARAVGLVTAALSDGKKLLFAGNGGSAADAQHIACEFVARFNFDRAPLAAIALTTDSSVLTSISNDYGFEQVFARQIRGLGAPGDVFCGISTSGRSPNILAGLKVARECGLTTVGFTGSAESPMLELCDEALRVPCDRTPFIQQVHITLGHILCAIAEERIFGRASAATAAP